MFGLKNPLPQISRASAVKKAVCRSTRRIEWPPIVIEKFQSTTISNWPRAMSRPPKITARPLPQEPVGQQAAEKGRHVDQRRVGPIDGIGIGVAVTKKALGHVENQQGPHAVEGEPLPHLRKEEREKSGRMAKQRGGIGERGFTGLIHCICAWKNLEFADFTRQGSPEKGQRRNLSAAMGSL